MDSLLRYPHEKVPAKIAHDPSKDFSYLKIYILSPTLFLEIDVSDTVFDPDLRSIGLAELLEIP